MPFDILFLPLDPILRAFRIVIALIIYQLTGKQMISQLF